MNKGKLFIVSGPSGAGKGTLLSHVLDHMENIRFSVSATTRPPREGEEEGVHYFFVSPEKFKDMIRKGEFLEWAEVHGHHYGTPQKSVDRIRDEGQDVILDVDVKGMRSVRGKVPEAIAIFIQPPDFQELRRRLEGRHTEKGVEIEQRLRHAQEEIRASAEYDHVVINDDLENACKRFQDTIEKERRKC